MRFSTLLAFSTIVAIVPGSLGGILTYGICQTGCNALAVACYGAAGVQFGTVLAPAAPATIVGCNAALGSCMAACAVVALTNPI